MHVASGKESDALKELRGLDWVKEAHIINKGFDIVVIVVADTMDRLKERARYIRKIDTVYSTTPLRVLRDSPAKD